MDISNLVRNKRAVLSTLSMLPDRSVIATKKLSITIPKRFERSNLCEVTEKVVCVGAVGIVVDNYYAPQCVLARLTYTSGDIEETVINGEKYYLLNFLPGETVIERMRVATESLIGYQFYMEFKKYGRLPWYLEYEDVNSALDEAKYYTGKSTSNSAQALRVIDSLTCRDPDNPDLSFRYGKSIDDLNKRPVVIGVNNPGQLLTGAFARMGGGYTDENTTAALLENNVDTTDIEKVLKGEVV